MSGSYHFALMASLLVGLVLCLPSSATAIKAAHVRSSNPSEVAIASRQVLAPAIQSLVFAPIRVLRQLFAELADFLRTHNFRELLDYSFLRRLMLAAPKRVGTYYNALVSMETQCMHRTVCDLTDLASRQLPKWGIEIATIYLRTFMDTRHIYQVMFDGLTSRKCALIYRDCNPDQFLDEINANLTEAVTSTVAPIQEALSNLFNVTTSTLNSLSVIDNEPASDSSPSEIVNPNRLNFSDLSEDDDEEEEKRSQNRFNTGHRVNTHNQFQNSRRP